MNFFFFILTLLMINTFESLLHATLTWNIKDVKIIPSNLNAIRGFYMYMRLSVHPKWKRDCCTWICNKTNVYQFPSCLFVNELLYSRFFLFFFPRITPFFTHKLKIETDVGWKMNEMKCYWQGIEWRMNLIELNVYFNL